MSDNAPAPAPSATPAPPAPSATPAPEGDVVSAATPPVAKESGFHALPAEAALAKVEATPHGLTHQAAQERLARHGHNRLPPPRRRGPLMRFLVQFHNVLIYVLLAAAGVTALLDHWVDTGVILGVVLINALIGFIQEGKAEAALEAIRQMLSAEASVLRDGHRIQIPAEDIVPGDIVYLQSGDRIPADLRLMRTKGLQVEEAALTGESLAVEKGVEPVAPDAALGDRSGMAYSGTLVTHGQGSGVVVATGVATEIGRISTMIAEVQTLTTPLLRQIATFGRWLTIGILGIAALTFAFGVIVRGYTFGEMFLAAVGLAVAAIPEGLPAIITITLAIGVQRMASRNAIVRRLPAVETLGSVTVICSDKTGTLTRNEMTVQSIATARNLFEVSGTGYAPLGSFSLAGEEADIDDHPMLTEMTRGAALCSDATLQEQEEGSWVVHGDPTEGALVTVACKAGHEPEALAKTMPRDDEIPFESEHRFMATLHHDHEDRGMIYVKGAPERLLEMCDRQMSRDGEEPLDQAYWLGRMGEIAERGQRVLALACREAPANQKTLGFKDVEGGLVLLGLFGLADPPRPEAISAATRCRDAGIRVKMITGDHAKTAQAIGTAIGLESRGGVITGQDIDSLDDDALKDQVRDVDIFARASPEHKLRLVQALQASGQVVAMTGDGVNDAPALKRADVGVAMGKKGTEAAKEAAEMVLADDNFATIASAVEEGRTIYDNIKKSIVFILPTNAGEGGMIIAAILFGSLLPITPVQILWVNMITAVTLALALAFEPAEDRVMQRPPRDTNAPILSIMLIWRILFVGSILVVGTFGLFWWAKTTYADIEIARTVSVNTLVMFEVFYLFNTRFLEAPVLNRQGLLGSRIAVTAALLVIGFQLLYTYAPFMQYLFDSRPIGAVTWLWIVLVGSSVLFLVEAEKWLMELRRRRSG